MFMLAADHRWQWDEWCDRHGVLRTRIPEAKALALEGFLRARARSPDIAVCGSILLDAQYASEAIASARAAGVAVGTPAEWPGAFPLHWASEPFDRALAGEFVKVLVRHRPDFPYDVIGRSVYFDAAAAWLLGSIPRDDAVERIADTYTELVRLWNSW